jgi:hypothetical protein
MTAPKSRRNAACDLPPPAPRLARDGAGYSARLRPAPFDPIAWFDYAVGDGRDDEKEAHGPAATRREDDER